MDAADSEPPRGQVRLSLRKFKTIQNGAARTSYGTAWGVAKQCETKGVWGGKTQKLGVTR